VENIGIGHKHFIIRCGVNHHVTDRKCFLNIFGIAAVTFENMMIIFLFFSRRADSFLSEKQLFHCNY